MSARYENDAHSASVGSKAVVAEPVALGNEGVAAERGVVISGRGRRRPRYLPSRARAEDKHRTAGKEVSAERETEGIGILFHTQKEFGYCSPTSNQVYFTLLFTRAMPSWFTLSLARLARLNIVMIVFGRRSLEHSQSIINNIPHASASPVASAASAGADSPSAAGASASAAAGLASS